MRNSRQKFEVEPIEEPCLMPFPHLWLAQLPSLCSPDPPSDTLGLAFFYQLAVKKMPHRNGHSSIWSSLFLNWGSHFPGIASWPPRSLHPEFVLPFDTQCRKAKVGKSNCKSAQRDHTIVGYIPGVCLTGVICLLTGYPLGNYQRHRCKKVDWRQAPGLKVKMSLRGAICGVEEVTAY